MRRERLPTRLQRQIWRTPRKQTVRMLGRDAHGAGWAGLARAVTMPTATRPFAVRARLQAALRSGAWRTDSTAKDALVQLATAAGADGQVRAVIEQAPSAARCLLRGEATVTAARRFGRPEGGARGGGEVIAGVLTTARFRAACEELAEALRSGAWRTDSTAKDALVQLATAAGADGPVLVVIRNAPSAARCLLEDGANVTAAWRCGRPGRREAAFRARGGGESMA